MNSSQHTTLNMLLLLAVVVVVTSKRSLAFWQTLLTPNPLIIQPPKLSLSLPSLTGGGPGSITFDNTKPNA